jgi:hypothetical protein
MQDAFRGRWEPERLTGRILMSQAALDHPDPLADPMVDPGLSQQAADELLSQMAGDEVDRLLRQNDLADAPVASPAAPEFQQSPTPAEPQGTAPSQPVPPAADPEPAPPPEKPAEIDSLLAQLTDGPDTVEPVVAFEDAADEPGTALEERAALHGSAPAVEPALVAIESAVQKSASEPRPPLLSRLIAALELPLRLINAPIAGLSPATRTAIGKIAIVTLFNATAVLIYVVWFKK